MGGTSSFGSLEGINGGERWLWLWIKHVEDCAREIGVAEDGVEVLIRAGEMVWLRLCDEVVVN